MSKDLLQLHMKSTLMPLTEGYLTDIEKYEALEFLMLLKYKHNGSVKGQSCANCRKQRRGSSKEDAKSPTVSLEAVLITSAIRKYEEREVAIVDLPGAFITADKDEIINMPLRGKLAKIRVKTAP